MVGRSRRRRRVTRPAHPVAPDELRCSRPLEAVALEDVDLGELRFDKIFAFNVAPFWLEPNEALAVVREHLAPRGAVYVFWDARRQTASDLGKRLSQRLLQGGFAIDRVLRKKLRPVPAVCVIGRV